MPIIDLDGHQIGDGKPGDITMALRAVILIWNKETLFYGESVGIYGVSAKAGDISHGKTT